jgi:hypothetical protein
MALSSVGMLSSLSSLYPFLALFTPLLATYIALAFNRQRPLSGSAVLDAIYTAYMRKEPEEDYLGKYLKLSSIFSLILPFFLIIICTVLAYYNAIDTYGAVIGTIIMYAFVDLVTRKRIRGGKSEEVFLPFIREGKRDLPKGKLYILYSSAIMKILWYYFLLAFLFSLSVSILIIFIHPVNSIEIDNKLSSIGGTLLALGLSLLIVPAFWDMRWATHKKLTKEILKRSEISAKIYFNTKGDPKGSSQEGRVVAVTPYFVLEYPENHKEGEKKWREQIRMSHINRLAVSIKFFEESK